MNAKEALNSVLRYTGTTQKQAAELMKWTPAQLSLRVKRGSLRVDDFMTILDMLGIDVQFIDRKTGKNVRPPIRGHGRRVSRMVNLVTYDTANADAITSNFYADGKNEYNDGMAMELYIDQEGRYFFAQYSSMGGVRDSIIPVEKEDAMAFIAKYGHLSSEDHKHNV